MVLEKEHPIFVGKEGLKRVLEFMDIDGRLGVIRERTEVFPEQQHFGLQSFWVLSKYGPCFGQSRVQPKSPEHTLKIINST